MDFPYTLEWYLPIQEALLTLCVNDPIACLKQIDHIRDLGWCWHQCMYDMLSTLESWCIESWLE